MALINLFRIICVFLILVNPAIASEDSQKRTESLPKWKTGTIMDYNCDGNISKTYKLEVVSSHEDIRTESFYDKQKMKFETKPLRETIYTVIESRDGKAATQKRRAWQFFSRTFLSSESKDYKNIGNVTDMSKPFDSLKVGVDRSYRNLIVVKSLTDPNKSASNLEWKFRSVVSRATIKRDGKDLDVLVVREYQIPKGRDLAPSEQPRADEKFYFDPQMGSIVRIERKFLTGNQEVCNLKTPAAKAANQAID